MLLRKSHVYRLYPTPEQAATLGRWAGAVRATYNVALSQRRDFYRPGRSFNFASQCREVTALRAEFDWLRDVPVHPLQQAVKDLQRAYETWWKALAAWKVLPPEAKAKTPRPGPPSPRKRGLNDSMRFPDPAHFAFRRLSRRLGEVKLPKLGWVRLRWDRAIPGTIKNLTVARRAGIWTVAAQYEAEVPDPAPSTLPAVGIDRGVAVFAALSTGAMIAPVNAGKRASGRCGPWRGRNASYPGRKRAAPTGARPSPAWRACICGWRTRARISCTKPPRPWPRTTARSC